MLVSKTLKQTIKSLLPIIIIVSFLSIFKVSDDNFYYQNFLVGFIFVFLGLVCLYLGLSVAIDKLAHDLSYKLVKTGKKHLALIVGGIISLVIVLAEPSLLIISKDMTKLSSGSLQWFSIMLAISGSMTLFMILGLMRILFRLRIKTILLINYILVCAMLGVIFLVKPQYLTTSLDLACSATGALSVPFFLSFGIGLGRNIKNSFESQRFGLVGIIASGSFIGSTIYFLVAPSSKINTAELTGNTTSSFASELGGASLIGIISSAMALLPFLFFFIVFHFALLKYDKFNFIKVCFGLLFLFLGLFFYLTGLNFGFMKTARIIGGFLSRLHTAVVLVVSFLVGFFCLYAESSVAVLGDRINEVTSGSLRPQVIVLVLAIGAGVASSLYFLFIHFEISLIFLVCGLLASCLCLSQYTSSLFVGIAFDAGAVSSGPMAGAFLLPFLQGAFITSKTNLQVHHLFGILSLITFFPVLLILSFGIWYQKQNLKLIKQRSVV